MNWVDVKYSNMYQINIFGQIKSKYTNKILKQHPDKDGYFRVVLWYNKKTHNFIIHRLIAEHFIDNPNNLKQINHKDGNKQNNSIENLEWISALENRRHAFKTGLQIGKKGLKHHNVKLKEADVYEIRKQCKSGISQSLISKIFNVRQSTISKINLRVRWKHLKEL